MWANTKLATKEIVIEPFITIQSSSSIKILQMFYSCRTFLHSPVWIIQSTGWIVFFPYNWLTDFSFFSLPNSDSIRGNLIYQQAVWKCKKIVSSVLTPLELHKKSTPTMNKTTNLKPNINGQFSGTVPHFTSTKGCWFGIWSVIYLWCLHVISWRFFCRHFMLSFRLLRAQGSNQGKTLKPTFKMHILYQNT